MTSSGPWHLVRSIQDLCRGLEKVEVEWQARHFAERDTTRWLLLKKAVDSGYDHPQAPQDEDASDASAVIARSLRAWQQWLTSPIMSGTDLAAAAASSGLPPPALVAAPGASIGAVVLQAAVGGTPETNAREFSQETEKAWIGAFRRKPVDTQMLVWLHMVWPRLIACNSTWLEKTLWNLVTVVQHSPLPFAVRARLTLLAYLCAAPPSGSPPSPPPSASPAVNSGAGTLTPLTAREVWRLAKLGGVEREWAKTSWETLEFASTPDDIRSDLRATGNPTPPERSNVYDILRKLDGQNSKLDEAKDAGATSIVLRMVHVLNLLLLADACRTDGVIPLLAVGARREQQGHAATLPLMHAVLTGLAQPGIELMRSNPSLAADVARIAKYLHLHSLMSFAQMRRATIQFWTLFYALCSPHARLQYHPL